MNEFVNVRLLREKVIKGKIKELLKLLKEKQKRIIEKINSIILTHLDENGKVTLDSQFISQVHDAITEELNQLNKEEKKIVEDALIDAYSESYKQTSDLLNLKKDWDILRSEFVKQAVDTPIKGTRFSTAIWKNTNDLANRIHDDVLDIVRNGTRYNEVSKRIKDDFGVKAYEAKRLVNTELAKTVNAAQLEVYKNSGFVQTVLWTATLESNTCEKCGNLDGEQFRLDSAPELPMHPNCRCCLIPVVDGHLPKMRANNETKKSQRYTTFKEWNS